MSEQSRHDDILGDSATGPEPVVEEAVDPRKQPAAGGTSGGRPAQGEGAPDSH